MGWNSEDNLWKSCPSTVSPGDRAEVVKDGTYP